MKILAIDTSFDACSVAIVDRGAPVFSETRIIGRGHSEALPVMVADGLGRTGLSAADFDRIGVVIGPGAFAGVRVGLAFARAFRLGFSAVAVGVSSSYALAATVRGGSVAPVFDARRGQVYAALYDETLRERIAPFVAAPAEAARRLREARTPMFSIAGSGASLIAAHFDAPPPDLGAPPIDPVKVALLAGAAETPGAAPAPLYLRPPDATPAAGSIFQAGRSS
jgi:tRNA threonylcarbamoyladenosine biosynthesis protein TsaB